MATCTLFGGWYAVGLLSKLDARIRSVSSQAAVLSLISILLLVFMLRGTLPKTYFERNFSNLDVEFLAYGVGKPAQWDWSNNWTKTDLGVPGALILQNGILSLEVSFSEGTQQAVKISRSVDLAVADFPIFRFLAWLSRGATWHVRLLCHSAERGQVSLSLPLGEGVGFSSWRTHSVNIEGLVTQDQRLDRVVLIEITLENSNFRDSFGPKTLMISGMEFLSRSAGLQHVGESVSGFREGFHAVIFRLPSDALPAHGWTIRWMTLEYEATSDSRVGYKAALVFRDRPLRGYVGPSFSTQAESRMDFYRLDTAAEPGDIRLEEMTFLSNTASEMSLIVCSTGFESSAFTSFVLRSVRIVYHLPLRPVGITLTEALLQRMLLLLFGLVFALPAGCLGVVFKHNTFERRPRMMLALVLSVGLISRILLSPFTGHAYDMEVWGYCARSFYESGAFDAMNAPLPITYYVVLIGYLPYVILRRLGLEDVRFLNHTVGVVESVFIKIPFILSDLAALLLLTQVLRKIGDKRATQHASLFWLNPLTILLSGVWGMYDSVAIVLLIFGLVTMFLHGRQVMSAILFVLSGLTKGFGFLGFVPLFLLLLRDRKVATLVKVAAASLGVVLLMFTPVIVSGGLPSLADFWIEFMRSRGGIGSQASAAGASYMSYLDLIGLRPQAQYLNVLLAVVVLGLSLWLARKLREAQGIVQEIKAASSFLALAAIAVYLLFFRVYEQYYIWVLPFLVICSVLRERTTPSVVGFLLGCCVSAVVAPLGFLLAGRPHHFAQVNHPADAAILALAPSFIVVAALLSVVDLDNIGQDSGSLVGLVVTLSVGSWLSTELGHHVYGGVLVWGNLLWGSAILALYVLINSGYIEKRLRNRTGQN